MLKPLSAAALACVGLTLAGCSNPPIVIQSDPVIIEHEQTLDRVHNRDASVEFYGESRGGAAVRKNMAAHVLWKPSASLNWKTNVCLKPNARQKRRPKWPRRRLRQLATARIEASMR